MEVKRMFTVSSKRGKGYAGLVLAELEKWAAEFSAEKSAFWKPEPASLML